MSSIKEYLTTDHGKCDEVFALMEEKANVSLSDAKETYEEFVKITERHFQMEERVMFVEFEAKTGMTQGPTEMMRQEHAQIRSLSKQMGEALEAANKVSKSLVYPLPIVIVSSDFLCCTVKPARALTS